MKSVRLLLLLFLIPSIAFTQATDKRLKGIEKELNELLGNWKAPGFAVAVVEGNEVIYSNGFGQRDIEKGLPVTANTLFAIGSCSKSFTSALLGILRSETELTFDDPPGKYIDGLKFYNNEMNDQITIRDLMCHRTGLPRHDYSWYFFPTDNRDSLMARIEFQEPTFGVREQWQYNNFMFLAQGVIAEEVTGKSWEDNIRERFFKPLGMNTAAVDIKEMTSRADYATGYELKNDEVIRSMDYYEIRGMAPAGSINSSVNEMTAWLKVWINGGKFNGKEIIPADYAQEAMSSQMVVTAGLPSAELPDAFLANYGYGWFLSSYRGHYRVEHGGNIDGFSASTSFFPSDSLGIVVLTNQNGSPIPGIVRNLVADRMLGLNKINWSDRLKKQRDEQIAAQQETVKSTSSNRKENTQLSHPITDYTGSFENPAAGKIRVTFRNDSLFANSNDASLWLEHYHYDVFEPHFINKYGVDTTSSLLRVVYQTDASGDISGFTLNIEPTLDPILFKRAIEAVDITEGELQKYTGEYELGGMVARFFTKDDELHLIVPNQPEYTLIPTGDDSFAIKGLDGFKVKFTANDSGKITEAVFTQPNGVFAAKRKE
ncbi:serine hydrolase [Fulvivirga sedimenti]|uniref:Serine hydrolase n=1 Tax=Fulvivirga sedimenti TaxID=2879465 RepID=A0A9X1HV57_9BACT|nr:serine hydrolase [Fulvivirga sedimenti]MCA6075328.1 serine hydrolase [Fulvivirga sedimenti]MCA6076505.1 serine hydrolase [Fulvivirga sedimenti]MCA6077633.1 serine hydrolase [Fulvivirga sedimenti]